jgi:hypothetical protein
MTSFAFRETLMSHLLLWGNAYAQIIRNARGEVIALYPLMPNKMTVDRDANGRLFYLYQRSREDTPSLGKDSHVYLTPSDVLHIPGLGFDGLVGYSPIAMAKNAVGLAIATEEYGAKFFANGAAPGGVLEHPGTIKDPQKVKDSWNAAYQGSRNSHRVAVLEEGMKYQPIGISPEQAQFLETRKFQINEIARIFRVPPHKRYIGPDDGFLGKHQYNNHWNQDRPDGRQVCVHAFIGKLADGSIATYQTLPWNHRGWHGGSGAKGSVNDTHIGFEICEDGLTDVSYFNAVYKEAAVLCAYLCKEYNLDPTADGVIIGHFEGHKRGIASNHGDPNNWFPKHGKSMDTFRAEVKSLLATTETPTPSEPRKLYRVQVGAYSVKANADAMLAKIKAAGFKDAFIKYSE